MRILAIGLALLAMGSCRSHPIDSDIKVDEFPVQDWLTNNNDPFESVSLFYVTNRRVDEDELYRHGANYMNPDKAASLAKVFSGDRHYPFTNREDPKTDNNFYGMLQVAIPPTHRRGKFLQASAANFSVTSHVGLLNIWLYEDASDFKNKIETAANTASNHDIFVLIHGFNMTFKDAAESFGAFIYDIDFRGVPILYSWSSDGTSLAYRDDEDDLRWSEVGFATFMDRVWEIQRQLGGKVHILAHSMGNRLLIQHLFGMREKHALDSTTPPFTNVIFAAPDIDGTEFSDKLIKSKHLAQQFTLYANENDLALKMSKYRHTWWRRLSYSIGLSTAGASDRAGASGDKKIITSKLDTIDLSLLKTGGLNHCDFATNPLVIQDISSIINQGLPIGTRLQKFQSMSIKTESYKLDSRIKTGLPTTFYQFNAETPLTHVLGDASAYYKGSLYRTNSVNSIYLKLYDKYNRFFGDFTFSRDNADRYSTVWGVDGVLSLIPSACEVRVTSRVGRYDYKLNGKKDSFGCQELQKLIRE